MLIVERWDDNWCLQEEKSQCCKAALNVLLNKEDPRYVQLERVLSTIFIVACNEGVLSLSYVSLLSLFGFLFSAFSSILLFFAKQNLANCLLLTLLIRQMSWMNYAWMGFHSSHLCPLSLPLLPPSSLHPFPIFERFWMFTICDQNLWSSALKFAVHCFLKESVLYRLAS